MLKVEIRIHFYPCTLEVLSNEWHILLNSLWFNPMGGTWASSFEKEAIRMVPPNFAKVMAIGKKSRS